MEAREAEQEKRYFVREAIYAKALRERDDTI